MIERERLIETICEGLAQNCGGTCTLPNKMYCQNCHILADYLLKNGVIPLPANIGDTVYRIGTVFTKCTPYDYKPKYYDDSECIGCEVKCDSEPYDVIHKGTIVNFKYDGKLFVQVKWENKFDTSYYEIGKDVFLSEDEVEKMIVEKIPKE